MKVFLVSRTHFRVTDDGGLWALSPGGTDFVFLKQYPGPEEAEAAVYRMSRKAYEVIELTATKEAENA